MTHVMMGERTTRHLIVLDVDGTLTRTNMIHRKLFVRAIKEVLGIEEMDTDWSHYRTVTDAGVTAEIMERNGLGGDVQSVRDRFVALLQTVLASEKIVAIPGAARMLSMLREHAHFQCALATGTWHQPLLLKTSHAGLVIEDLPMATSSDSPQREEIVQLSIERARSQYHLPANIPITLVGDGLWDLKVATHLGYPFVGIGSGPQASLLRENGAQHVIEDFMDLDQFFELIVQG